jgi:diguanylate cyclase (GGDEF)-like protein
MDLGSIANLPSLILQVGITLVFGLVFLFLWRQSGIVYFGLWSLIWAIESGALVLAYGYVTQRGSGWLGPYALMEFTVAVLLFAAGRAGFSGPVRNWRAPLKVLFGFPVFLVLVYLLAWHTRPQAVQALHGAVLCSLYAYNYTGIGGTGMGARAFRISLLALAILFFSYGAVLIDPALRAARTLPAHYYDLGLHAILTLAAMAMWIETQHQRVGELAAELERVRSESSGRDLDHLTGLLNQAALDHRLAENLPFQGIIAVCDMDNFKEINDRYGHLTGDEILRNIGNLFQTSIRKEDEAYRWGGDEFVFLFHNQDRDVVIQRMRELQDRLQLFRLRGLGVLPISFSFGTTEVTGGSLRVALDEADHAMYRQKGARRT